MLLSFSPLPPGFLQYMTELESLASPQILDLGAGQGGFSQSFSDSPLKIWELDRSPVEAGVQVHLRGDALVPPIVPHSLHGLLAGNLVRHLCVQEKESEFLSRWLDLLKPGGRLYIFEDEPQSDDPAAANFRDLQNFLAQLMPGQRGPLLSLGEFLKMAEDWTPGVAWKSGVLENKNHPNSALVCDMLRGGQKYGQPAGAAGRLLRSIEKFGLGYGAYWWASATGE